jgi:cobalt-zinc-cadmium efflux system protein
MQSVPEGMNLDQVAREVRGVEGVQDVHHMHVWQLDETSANLEAHLVLHQCDFEQMARVKSEVKQRLQQVFNINHTTLEIEFSRCDVCVDDKCYDIRPGND